MLDRITHLKKREAAGIWRKYVYQEIAQVHDDHVTTRHY
jgi:hypothetical protein